jgi:hypothetical protein
MNHTGPFLREVAAYHEAGHVVIRHVLGFTLEPTTSAPALDANDDVQYADPLRGIELGTDGSDEARLRLEKAIQISYAGAFAQHEFKGEHSRWLDHGKLDFEVAEELGLNACGSKAQNVHFQHWLRTATEEMVRAHWVDIDRVAKELQTRGSITGAEITALLRSPH